MRTSQAAYSSEPGHLAPSQPNWQAAGWPLCHSLLCQLMTVCLTPPPLWGPRGCWVGRLDPRISVLTGALRSPGLLLHVSPWDLLDKSPNSWPSGFCLFTCPARPATPFLDSSNSQANFLNSKDCLPESPTQRIWLHTPRPFSTISHVGA